MACYNAPRFCCHGTVTHFVVSCDTTEAGTVTQFVMSCDTTEAGTHLQSSENYFLDGRKVALPEDLRLLP